jgi:acyl-CoA synthetase (AMP-forming)/AMP-acid ligase II
MGYDEIVRELTGKDGPFELVVENVRGLPMRNFKHREHSLREKIANSAARGDTPCLVCGDRRITYAEHARLVWGTAHNLKNKFGARKGDRVAVLAYNSPEWLIAVFGATSMGATAVD